MTASLATSASAEDNATRLLDAARTATASGMGVRVAAGRYAVRGPVQLPAGVRLQLDPGAVLVSDTGGGGVLRLQGRSAVLGGAIVNTAGSDNFGIELAQGASGVLIRGVTFQGGSSNAIYTSAAGVDSLAITGNLFDGVNYGILINEGADTTGLTISGNTFRGIRSDAVEVNAGDRGAAPHVRNVVISGNTVQDMAGSGPDSGFGVGLSGTADFTVEKNTFTNVRNEAVHVEAHSQGGRVSGNTVRGGGSRERPAIAIYKTVSGLTVQGNDIAGFNGSGVEVLWDSAGSASDVHVADNTVSKVSTRGIVVAGDAGTGPFEVRNNCVADSGDVAIGVYGGHASSTVQGNRVFRPGKGGAVDSWGGGAVRAISGNTLSSSGGC